ncbi:MAG: phage integrase N-terminal SAM-like domain-containing protein [Bradyrhizobium sp.]|nr:phage integrase N-terminal SAM-like domain-containing protein [Bradyrhizobium sp.]MBV9984231.1 phage integrase N-terminal SAM-like domain-containing protein [Bradyrhizobium sp.]
MSEKPISPLRQRMLDDMSLRRFTPDTQRDYIRAVKKLTAFLGRSPDTATAEELRAFQLHLTETGVQPPTINTTVTVLRFFFNPMGVTREIAQHLLGACERRLAIDHPLDAPQRGDEALERSLVGKPGMGVEERQLVGVVRLHEHRQHLAAEQTRQHVDVDEEVGACGDPSCAVEREPATRHDHVHVRMMGERRAPGVQHGRDTDPCAEALGISGDGERRLGRRLHQQVIDHALVLVGDVAQLARQRVHNVEVWHRQQLRFAVGQPLA